MAENKKQDTKQNIIEPVKGFKDYTGLDAVKREKVQEKIKDIFKKFGFEPAETPVIEYTDFVVGENERDEAVSDTFRLKDKGDRKLALRYEFTFQLKRISQNKKLPYKRYQIGYVFRDEPVTGNRVRQITQCDVDIVGGSVREDAELLALATKLFQELGIKITIYINSRELLNEILDEAGIKEKEEVIREIDKIGKLPEQKIRENLTKYGAENILEIFKNKERSFEKYKMYWQIKALKEYCDLYGIKVIYSPSLARGLSYYNGNVFEIKSKDMKETIAAGGSYLVNGIQSTGISFGLDRISQLYKLKETEKNCLVISIGQDELAIKLVNDIRARGLPCEIMYGKPSKALEYANSKSISYVLFVGKEEIEKKKIKLKNMKTGKEQLLTEKQVLKELE